MKFRINVTTKFLLYFLSHRKHVSQVACLVKRHKQQFLGKTRHNIIRIILDLRWRLNLGYFKCTQYKIAHRHKPASFTHATANDDNVYTTLNENCRKEQPTQQTVGILDSIYFSQLDCSPNCYRVAMLCYLAAAVPLFTVSQLKHGNHTQRDTNAES